MTQLTNSNSKVSKAINAQGIQFNAWCKSTKVPFGKHDLCLLTGEPAKVATGIEATAAVVPGHYVSGTQISQAFARLGKTAAAKLIETKLPTWKNSRSGDLGEIYATEWIDAHSDGYVAPIKRLRWRDHRNMAMRGDDVIAIRPNSQPQRLRFLKAEAKSRVTLTKSVIAEARTALDENGGHPSPHALLFVADRLAELGDSPLSAAIYGVHLGDGIKTQNVHHLMFTFSGNAPNKLLTESLQTYQGEIPQLCVGLRVDGHADFVQAVYERVIANANNT